MSVFLTYSPLSTEVIPPNKPIRKVNTTEKVVALTFDDGPYPFYTSQILDILNKHKIKATFFMIGNRIEKHPEIVKAADKDGHVIANHTYSHPRMFYQTNAKAMGLEISRFDEVISKLGISRSHLFRPPRGFVGLQGLAVAKEKGDEIILWTVCADHHDAPTPKLMAQRVIKAASPGCIILLHDGSFSSRWKDVAATKLIIDALLKKGYKFVTIPQLLAMQKIDIGPAPKVSPAKEDKMSKPTQP